MSAPERPPGRPEEGRAERALKESEERYRTLIESSPDAILLLDEDLKVRAGNRSAAALFGGEAAGRNVLELVAPEQRAALAPRLSGPAGARAAVVEVTLAPPGGRPLAAELSVSRADVPGAPGVVMVVRDVSERRRAELLREVQLRVTRVLADAVSLEEAAERLVPAIAGVFRWDLGTLFLVDREENVLVPASSWSAPDAGFAHLLRDRPRAAPGQGLAGRVWSSASALFLSELRGASGSLRVDEAARAGLKRALAFPVLSGTEIVGVFEFLAREMDDPNEALLATLAQLGALTGAFVARRRAEDASRESDRRFRELAEELDREQRFLLALLDTLAEGIVACDAEGRLTLFNRATRELHGLGSEPAGPDLSGGYELCHADGRTPLSPGEVPLFRAFRGEIVEDQELVIKQKDGPPRTVLAHGRPIIDAAGQKLGAVVAMTDVTERRRLEDQFRQSQKMEALGSLAGGVAHDFNNLLTTILGYTELLMARHEDAALREDLNEVRKAGERATALTKKLLAFSRKQIVEARVLDLNAVVADLDRILRRLLGPQVELESRLDPRAGRVKADPGQLEQVLMNLVVNARDAMPGGGRIVVETGEVLVGEAEARAIVGGRPGPHVFLSVRDAGVGIAPELLPRIFEPFFTTKEEGKGTGLGLATVFGIVAQGGGHIRVESEPGTGTRMAIYLPRVDAPVTYRVSHPTLRVSGGSETILVVDDQEAVRGLARRVLEANGYAVLEAESGERALELASRVPRIDLLLTDAVMPGISGATLASRLRESGRALKVLFMSGYLDDALLAAEELSGAAFLPKPFTAHDLAERVRRALDEEP